MKFAEARASADPEKAARCIVEIASTIDPVQDGRIDSRRSMARSSSRTRAARRSTARAKLAERGSLAMHESGTFVRFTPAGAECSPKQQKRPRPFRAISGFTSVGGVSASTQQYFAAARLLIGGAGRFAFSGSPVTFDLFLTRPVEFRQSHGRLRGYVRGQCQWSFA